MRQFHALSGLRRAREEIPFPCFRNVLQQLTTFAANAFRRQSGARGASTWICFVILSRRRRVQRDVLDVKEYVETVQDGVPCAKYL